MPRRRPTPIGAKFNHLTIIGDAPDAITEKYVTRCVVARCDCGTVKTYRFGNLVSLSVKGCGCKLSYKPKIKPVNTKRHTSKMNLVKLANIRLMELGLATKKLNSLWMSKMHNRTRELFLR